MMTELVHYIQTHQRLKNIYAILMMLLSALVQAYVLKIFMEPANIISGGFTGLSLLINKMTGLSTSWGIVLLNTPVALFCWRHLSKRFVWLSMLQYVAVSVFILFIEAPSLMNDAFLNVIFGGLLWGVSIALTLRAGGSTGGTDFIAQYVSFKLHRGIWDYVFAYNCLLYIVFGSHFGWKYAAYSIIFQFFSTRMISTLYQRYSQVTIEFTSSHPEVVIDAFMATCRHGMSVFEGYGGYGHQKTYLCKSVVSAYQVKDVIHAVRKAEPKVIINTYKTSQFYGNFYQKPIDD